MVDSIETPTTDGAPEVAKAKVKAKKGTRSWQPAAPLAIKSRDPNTRIKWVSTDPANMLRKRAEGWEPAMAGDASHARPNGVDNGKGIPAGVTEFRDMVLMKMPEEMARERDAYYQKRAADQLGAIKNRAKTEIRNATGVPVDGEITIE